MTSLIGIIDVDIYRVFGLGSAILFLRFVIMYFQKIRNFALQYVFEVSEEVRFSSHSNVAYTEPNKDRINKAENDFEYVVLWTLCTWFWLNTSPPYWLAATLIRIFVITETIGAVFYTKFSSPSAVRLVASCISQVILSYQIISLIFHLIWLKDGH